MHGYFDAFLTSDDFFQTQIFQKILSGIPSMSNRLDPDQADILSGVIWVQTVSNRLVSGQADCLA